MTAHATEMINNAHAELLQYLHEKDLNKIFVSIIEAILTKKPDNPFEFIVHFLKVILFLLLYFYHFHIRHQ